MFSFKEIIIGLPSGLILGLLAVVVWCSIGHLLMILEALN